VKYKREKKSLPLPPPGHHWDTLEGQWRPDGVRSKEDILAPPPLPPVLDVWGPEFDCRPPESIDWRKERRRVLAAYGLTPAQAPKQAPCPHKVTDCQKCIVQLVEILQEKEREKRHAGDTQPFANTRPKPVKLRGRGRKQFFAPGGANASI
jgi:hypothetical protein